MLTDLVALFSGSPAFFAGCVFVIGLVVGSQLPRNEGVSFFADSKVLWSALLWLVYLEALVAHKFFGRSARRFAVGVIVAFVFLLLTFGLTNKLSQLHHSPPQTTSSAMTTGVPAQKLVASCPSLINPE